MDSTEYEASPKAEKEKNVLTPPKLQCTLAQEHSAL